MIVSNSASPSIGALQGFDLLARRPKTESADPSASDFSGLLSASGRPEAPAPRGLRAAASSAPRPESRAVATGEKGFYESAADSVYSDSAGGRSVGVANAEPSGDAAAASLLGDVPPVIRDPRLDDPAELALEAAAVAAAALLLQKTQAPVLQTLVLDEPQTGLGAEQGGAQSDSGNEAASPGKALPTLTASGVEVSTASLLASQAQNSPTLAATVEGNSVEQAVHGRQEGAGLMVEPRSERQSRLPVGAAETALFNVVPTVVASVVVSANPTEAAALAQAGSALIGPAQTQAAAAGAPVVSPAAAAISERSPVRNPIPAASSHSQLSQSRSPLAGVTVSQAPTDAEIMAAPLPANPAAALFAGQVGIQAPKALIAAGLLQQETDHSGTALNGGGEGVEAAGGETQTASAVSPVLNVQDSPLEDGSNSVSPEGRDGGSGANAGTGQGSLASGQKAASAAFGDVSPSEPKFGTFGAENDGVKGETSPSMARFEDASTPAKAAVEESFSVVASGLDFSSTGVLQNGAVDRPAHEAASRPVVLPPVHVKSGELASVVQSALERARSQNPSHLAVEITLEDGSSFGLEVRMSASGLQAAFRSESQPLLKALENNWAGFVAKETAEARVVSAAFEGRSGFGEFSDSGSNAGERRQQFEDSASAARLSAQDRGTLQNGKMASGAAAMAAAPEKSTTLYA